MPKESFLFVPYNAGRQYPYNKIANSDVRSHAAAVSRQRRDNKRLRLETDACVSISQLGVTESVEPNQHSYHSNDDALSTVDHSGTQVLQRQNMRAMQFSWRAGNLSGNANPASGLRVDPFSTTLRDNFARSAADYFMQVISPVNQPVYTIFNVTNIYTSYWLELMQDEDYKPMGLAMVGAIMRRVGNSSVRQEEDVKGNHALAISRLQKKYDSAVLGEEVTDDMAIITVLGLANLARFDGDTRAYDTHRSSMKYMVSARGGLDALGHDGLVAAAVSQWDSFWAIQKGGVPLFSDSRQEHIPVYPAFPLSVELREIFMKLPVGFQSLILMGKISVELVDVLGRTAEAALNGIEALTASNPWNSKTQKHRDFLEACPTLAAADDAPSAIEKCLTLAIFFYCANTFTDERSLTSLFFSSRNELTRLLMKYDETILSQPEKECLFWICALSVDSWRQENVGAPLLPTGMTLLPVLKRMKRSFSSDNVLHRFFYNQSFLDCCDQYLMIPD